MNKLSANKPNDIWVVLRQDIDTIDEGPCNLYAFIDACSQYCFGMNAIEDVPTEIELNDWLQSAYAVGGKFGKKIGRRSSYEEIKRKKNNKSEI